MRALCGVCPRHCALSEGQTGFCRARKNVGGTIVCSNYGRVTSLALDPVEKKPLRRYKPGKMILSAGSYGCNLRCPFCQNHSISMADESAETVYISPEELTEKAASLVPRGNIGLAFTYNEPLVGYEYVLDCARMAKARGLDVVLVTNGTICEGPLRELLRYTDAMNIDLKGFTASFYRSLGGDLETVKRSIALAAGRCHVEVTTLVIPGENDGEDEMASLAGFLAGIDESLPLHISRFFPRHLMRDRESTPVSTVYSLRDVAARRLKYVYTGNC